MIKRGLFEKKSKSVKVKVDLNELKKGVNSLKNHFVILDADKNVNQVIDKVCDHAGGKLIKKGNSAICPMHGWKLDFSTLQYQDSHIKKTTIDFSVENNILKYDDSEVYLLNPFKSIQTKNNFKLRWLNHAAVHLSNSSLSLVTDPWLKGPAFLTGWWLDKPSTSDSIKLVKNADYIYIYHNHPDHLHPETLELLDKKIKIIVGDFASKSTEKYLRSLGFNNIYALEFNYIYEIGENFQICIFKSGDFRDDSGMYLNIDGVETLMTVDSNFLNSYVLPKNIDLLLTSFAGGASGFPLCYENYDLDQKLKIVKRNKLAIRASVLGYLNATSPKYYMPYAGMFKEKSERDLFVRENNKKNNSEDYRSIVEGMGRIFLNPQKDLVFSFEDGKSIKTQLDVSFLLEEDPGYYIDKYKKLYRYDSKKILDYLINSGYKGKQILYIIPTNDDFSEIINEIIFCDFNNQSFKVIKELEIIEELADYKVMKLYIREEIFAAIVQDKLPWEDFSIGFQMRVSRFPNEYESDFWYHFTNIYINSIHYKNDHNCGTCTVLNQNPIFNKI